MRKLVITAAVAGVLCTVAGGASAETRFRGTFTITHVRDCLARYVGETFNSAFRPAGVPGNPNVTTLSQLNAYSGDVYERAGRVSVGTTWLPFRAWGIDNQHYTFNARIRFTVLHPAVITPTSNFVQAVGTIENMGNDPGIGGRPCVASFRGAYFRRME